MGTDTITPLSSLGLYILGNLREVFDVFDNDHLPVGENEPGALPAPGQTGLVDHAPALSLAVYHVGLLGPVEGSGSEGMGGHAILHSSCSHVGLGVLELPRNGEQILTLAVVGHGYAGCCCCSSRCAMRLALASTMFLAAHSSFTRCRHWS